MVEPAVAQHQFEERGGSSSAIGFLYVKSECATQLRPHYLARFGVDIPATHEADYDPAPIQLMLAALRFDLGNYNFLAVALVTHTLDILNDLGPRQ